MLTTSIQLHGAISRLGSHKFRRHDRSPSTKHQAPSANPCKKSDTTGSDSIHLYAHEIHDPCHTRSDGSIHQSSAHSPSHRPIQATDAADSPYSDLTNRLSRPFAQEPGFFSLRNRHSKTDTSPSLVRGSRPNEMAFHAKIRWPVGCCGRG